MNSPTDRGYRPQHAKASSMPKALKALLGCFAVLVGIVVVAAGTFGVLWLVGRNASRSQAPTGALDGVDVDENGKRLTYQGHVYEYNDHLSNMLFIGTDRKVNSDQARVFGENGQADALYLISVDTETGAVNVLGIPRDTMTDVRMYSVTGEYIGVEKRQACLAFAYGDGKELSCENTVTSVSNLLYGLDIGTYFCMDWENIAVLNDMVGGVTVPEYDEQWQKTGRTVTLSGQDALTYLNARDLEHLDGSLNRVERHMNYLKSFSQTLTEQVRQDITMPIRMYNELSRVSIDTFDVSKLTFLSTVFLKGGAQVHFQTLTGDLRQGEEYAELYLNDEETYETMLRLFYKKIQ